MRRRSLPLLLLVVLFLAPPSRAEHWPHWRGPLGTGVSPERGLPIRWGIDENVAWKLPLPDKSGSTPIVWGERVFLSVADGEKLLLWVVDQPSGRLVWQRQLDDRNEDKRKGNLSSPSPVTDGERVWVMTGTGILSAFDFAGRPLWRRDLQQDFGTFGILHGYSSSPVLYRDAIIVQVLHGFFTDDPSYLLGFDKETGSLRWRVDRPSDAPKEAPDAYTTPALLQAGNESVLVVSGADYVTGHDPSSGRELWRVGGLNPTRNPMQRIVASPVVVGDIILVPSRVRPLLALRATRGIAHPPTVIWSMDRGPDVPTPAVDGNRAYLLNDSGILWCLDAGTGRVEWGPERIHSASYSASPLVADGKLYATSEDGVTTVVALDPTFQVIAENDLGEYTLSSLAVSEGRIYLRTAKHLFCIESTS